MSRSERSNLLVIDTSTPRAVLAVATTEGQVFLATPDPSARHGRVLVPAIRDLLDRAGLAALALDGFVVGLGPGSYTGLRIGLTAAKTLAYAAGKPLAGFDSLEGVARNAPDDAVHVSAIADAQRGALYAADFTRDHPGAPLRRILPTRVVALAEWSANLPVGAFVLGPAAAIGKLAAAIPACARRPDDPDDHWPQPVRIAELAVEVWQSGRRDDPWFLEPVYLRRSAAEDLWEARAAEHSLPHGKEDPHPPFGHPLPPGERQGEGRVGP